MGAGESYCCPSRSCGSDNLGGTLREPFVFSFGGGGVEIKLSMEKRNEESLSLGNRLGEREVSFHIYIFSL